MTEQQTVQTPPTNLRISEMEDGEREQILGGIYSHIAQGYQAGNFVREVRVHPDDVGLVQEYLGGMPMPELARQLARVTANEGHSGAGIVTQSDVETQWLAQHMEPLMAWLREQRSPIIPTQEDMRLLFLMEGMDEIRRKRPQLFIP